MSTPGAAGSAEDPRRGGTPAPSLFGVLEERVVGLLERYQKAQKRVDELERAIVDRESRLEALGQKLDAAESLRGELAARVARLIEEVAELEEAERRVAGEREG